MKLKSSLENLMNNSEINIPEERIKILSIILPIKINTSFSKNDLLLYKIFEKILIDKYISLGLVFNFEKQFSHLDPKC